MKKMMLLAMSAMAFAVHADSVKELEENVKKLENWKDSGVVKICGFEIGDSKEDLEKKGIFKKAVEGYKSLQGVLNKPFRQFDHAVVHFTEQGRVDKIQLFMQAPNREERRKEADVVAAVIKKKYGFDFPAAHSENDEYRTLFEKEWVVPGRLDGGTYASFVLRSVDLNKYKEEAYKLVYSGMEGYRKPEDNTKILCIEIEKKKKKKYDDLLHRLAELKKAESQASSEDLDAL